MNFKTFLQEQSKEHTCSFTFSDGNIPIDEGKFVNFKNFKPEEFGDHVTMELNKSVPTISIKNNNNNNSYKIDNTEDFMKKSYNLSYFLRILRGSK